MPRSNGFLPRYRKHRTSGQAVVTLSAQDIYLGPHGIQASKLEYDRHVAEWLARGRRPLGTTDGQDGITVVELIAAYRRFAKLYYRKNGVETKQVYVIMSAAAFVRSLYGRELANEFGSLKLQAGREVMIRAD